MSSFWDEADPGINVFNFWVIQPENVRVESISTNFLMLQILDSDGL